MPKKLTTLQAVLKILQSGRYLTCWEIQAKVTEMTGRYSSDSSISARIRDLRKHGYGKHQIDCRVIVIHGVSRWEYRFYRPKKAA